MPGPNPVSIDLSPRQREALNRITRRQLAPQNLLRRVRIVLEASEGRSNMAIAERLRVNRDTVITWRRRYAEAQPDLEETPSEKLSGAIESVLADRPRSGAPPTFSAEEVAQIMALACRDPEETGRAVSHWTPTELAEEARKQGIVETISPRTVGRFLKGG
jgi:putative transposase